VQLDDGSAIVCNGQDHPRVIGKTVEISPAAISRLSEKSFFKFHVYKKLRVGDPGFKSPAI
jgi:hypothetical protein